MARSTAAASMHFGKLCLRLRPISLCTFFKKHNLLVAMLLFNFESERKRLINKRKSNVIDSTRVIGSSFSQKFVPSRGIKNIQGRANFDRAPGFDFRKRDLPVSLIYLI